MASFPVPVEYRIVRNVQSVRTYVTELAQSNTPIVWAGINDGQLMDKPWINASSREFTVSSVGCAYRAELILGR